MRSVATTCVAWLTCDSDGNLVVIGVRGLVVDRLTDVDARVCDLQVMYVNIASLDLSVVGQLAVLLVPGDHDRILQNKSHVIVIDNRYRFIYLHCSISCDRCSWVRLNRPRAWWLSGASRSIRLSECESCYLGAWQSLFHSLCGAEKMVLSNRFQLFPLLLIQLFTIVLVTWTQSRWSKRRRGAWQVAKYVRYSWLGTSYIFTQGRG